MPIRLYLQSGTFHLSLIERLCDKLIYIFLKPGERKYIVAASEMDCLKSYASQCFPDDRLALNCATI